MHPEKDSLLFFALGIQLGQKSNEQVTRKFEVTFWAKKRAVLYVGNTRTLKWSGDLVTVCRAGASGEVVMQGGHGFVADFLPGEYNLVDLACFSDLPPLEPRHVEVKVSRTVKQQKVKDSPKSFP